MKNTKKLTLSGIFLALGIILPFFTMQIPEIGSMLLPMHIPVLLCGFLCGWQYGLAVGLIVPLLRSLMFGMPPIIPAVAMTPELACYGAAAGVLYALLKNKKLSEYIALIGAMVSGRIVWGFASLATYNFLLNQSFTWKIFVGGAFLQAIPGIIVQMVLIPPIVMLLKKKHIV